MKIIGVMGGSGSGKSTVAELIKENLGSSAEIIRIDDFMHEYTRVHSKQLLCYLGREENDGLLLNHLSESVENIKNWISYISSDIKREVDAAITQYEGKCSTVILDWAFLPLVGNLFSMCDVTIRVQTDYQLKMNRLRARLIANNKDEKWSEEDLKRRICNSDLEGYDYKQNFIISNDGSFDTTRESISYLSSLFRKMGFATDDMTM